MSKQILIGYEEKPMSFFGDGEWEIPVDLIVKKTYFFGLFTKVYKHRTSITMFEEISETKAAWDKLIRNQTPVK